MNKTEQAVTEPIKQLAENCGLLLYAAEYVKEGSQMVLRIYIDKESEGGASIDDCEKFSREISAWLDETDVIEKSFMLEVSTPGIERRLSLPWHFEKYTGSEVTVKLFSPQNGSKTHIGVLEGCGDVLTLSQNGEKTEFDIKNVASVNLYYKF